MSLSLRLVRRYSCLPPLRRGNNPAEDEETLFDAVSCALLRMRQTLLCQSTAHRRACLLAEFSASCLRLFSARHLAVSRRRCGRLGHVRRFRLQPAAQRTGEAQADFTAAHTSNADRGLGVSGAGFRGWHHQLHSRACATLKRLTRRCSEQAGAAGIACEFRPCPAPACR